MRPPVEPQNTFSRTQDLLTAKETSYAVTSVLIYITIYSFEAPIRYALNFAHLDALILFRDLLIDGPLAYVAVKQAMHGKINSVIATLVFIIIVQGAVFYLNYHAIVPIVLAAKLLVNVALGTMIGAALLNCTIVRLKYIAALFFISVVGVYVEKFVTTYPWVGMVTNIGGLEVAISMDWGGDDPLYHRTGGFTRISINTAGLLPVLAFILAPKCRSVLLRLVILLLATSGVVMTTQKGALAAALIVSGCLLLPTVKLRSWGLRLAVLTGAAAQILLPFVTAGMPISEGTGGVYTASSFAMRVIYTWPNSLAYLAEKSIGIFGAGLGSFGAAIRVIIPNAPWMFPDNMFIFIYGYLGVFVLGFYWAVVNSVWRSFRLPDEFTAAPLAVMAFVLWYGTVISVLEDQILSLAIGASVGTFLYARLLPVVVAPIMPRGRRIVHE